MKRQRDFLFYPRRVEVASIARACLPFMLVATSVGTSVLAQQPPVNTLPRGERIGSGAPSFSLKTDDRYRIGPGDVIEVRVFNRPQLSREDVRVDGHGMIRMPLIEDEIQAACRTESEVAREIAARYRRYHKRPHVDVFIKQYESKPVAVIGAVEKPGRFQLQRRVRLLELLSFAGGPTERAGARLQVAHTGAASACESNERDADIAEPEASEGFISYNLNETLRGDDEFNPYVRPGDIVTLLEAEQAFVVGNVFKPSAVSLKEPTTVSKAIAMAGGALPDTKSNRIRIIRQTPGSQSKTELLVDLEAINKRRAEDIALQTGDIVEVPTSSGKRVLRNLLSAIAPAVSQLPIYAVR